MIDFSSKFYFYKQLVKIPIRLGIYKNSDEPNFITTIANTLNYLKSSFRKVYFLLVKLIP